MSNCPSCGSNVEQGENFCRVCGTPITNVTSNQNLNTEINNSQNVQQNSVPQNNVPQSSMQNTGNSSNIDEDLVNAYMGPKAQDFKGGGFSIFAFLFGSLYALYRKMWFVGFGLIAITIVSNLFLKSLSEIITFVLGIYYSMQFKNWYYSHAKEQVNRIKQENPGKSEKELLTICAQKGGTTVVPIIIMGAIYLIIMVLAVAYVMTSKSALSRTTSPQSETMYNLNYTVPKYYIFDSNSDSNSKIYNNGSSCSLNIKAFDSYLYDNDAKTFLEKGIANTYSTQSETMQKDINNNVWYYTEVPNDEYQYYHYAISHDNKIYLVSFASKNSQNSICTDDYNDIINSLEFR